MERHGVGSVWNGAYFLSKVELFLKIRVVSFHTPLCIPYHFLEIHEVPG